MQRSTGGETEAVEFGGTAAESAEDLRALHEAYCLEGFTSRKFTHAHLWERLGPVTDHAHNLERRQIGSSAEGRPLYEVRFGSGPKRVLLWSQMHGDEPTHTMALADLFAYLAREPDDARARLIEERLTVVAIPMLNPDGAERFRRTNAQGIDINRDGLAALTPEMRVLRAVAAEVKPDFALNLHDQSPRRRVGRSDRLTAMALLANPFDETCGDNEARLRAKRLCAAIARGVAPLIAGHVGRYAEEFNPQGSGELMASAGASTLLVECGGWANDPEKQFVRTVSFVALLSALGAIADESYATIPISEYEAIEEDDSSVFDVLVRGGTVVVPGLEPYRADVGINFRSPFDRVEGRVVALGDFAEFAAREVVDASGLFLHPRPEALRASAGSPPVLGVGSPASFELRAGMDPGSERRMALHLGAVQPPLEAVSA